jgi:hypothetical protein
LSEVGASLLCCERRRDLAEALVGYLHDCEPRLAQQPSRETGVSYARIDGYAVAVGLRDALLSLDISNWFDEIAIQAGKSQSRQMDVGLAKARSGVVVLTPAYIAGRFWTERELGALLHKNAVIPVLHSVTFADVATYSCILSDLAGFTTEADAVETIAEKIAVASV